MKRQLPIILCGLLGLLLIVQYFVPHRLSQSFLDHVNNWFRIVTVFAFVIGIGSLIRVHLRRVFLRSHHWQYSLLVFVGILIMPLMAIFDSLQSDEVKLRLPSSLSTQLQDGRLNDTLRKEIENGGLEIAPIVDVKTIRSDQRWILQENKLQFTIDNQIETSILDDKKITAELRQIFADNGAELSETVQIDVQRRGKRWLIENGRGWYLVKKDQSVLKIYRDTRAKYTIKREGDELIFYSSKKFTKEGPKIEWLYFNVYVPLDATMFSLLAFFIASAAYRAFRARTLDATLLLVAGVILMFANAPFGNSLWNATLGKLPFLPIGGPTLLKDWILQVPGMAARRAIQIGLALGAISQSLRILLGIDRAWMGE